MQNTNNSFYVFLVSILLIIFLAVFYVLSSSYKLSIQAKYYYINDNFEIAYKLSSRAYEQDQYNRMAFTIQQQSEYALKVINALKEARKAYLRIKDITSKVNISTADMVRIEFICLNTIDRFNTMNFPLLNKSKLHKKVDYYKSEFEKILKKIKLEKENGLHTK